MRGLGKAVQALFALLASLGIPKWAIVLALGALAWWLVPKLVASIDKDRARRVIKQARLDTEADREAADATALEIAGDDPHTLVIVANEAIADGRLKLAESIVERLRRTGQRRRDLARLEDEIYGPLPTTSIEAAMRIESFLARRMWDKANQLAERSVRRWPDDTDLDALYQEALAAEATPPVSEEAAASEV